MAIETRPQASFDEEILEDADLEAQLEGREQAKRQAAAVTAGFRQLDAAAKEQILSLGVRGRLRCGRFLIDVKDAPGRQVSFETKPTTRVRITAPEGD
jgi:hypothetical protein